MKIKTLLMNAAVMTASVGFAGLLCEAAARFALNPADFLSVRMVNDPILGAIPAPGTGFDAWGFRNPGVPETAEIVAVGDSHTYGNTATMEDSWPSVVGRETGRSVYNLGMGGYGPNQYFHNFQTHALGLKPKVIVCGLYMGDDFENAYLITYGLEHWAYLRNGETRDVQADIWEDESVNPTWHKKIRMWFASHSLLYQLVFHGPLAGMLQGGVQIKNAEKIYEGATSLEIPEENISEAFRPLGIARNLDPASEMVQRGARITFTLLKQMQDTSREQGIQFLVVVIPTKEMVFAKYLEHRPNLHLGAEIDKMLVDERVMRERVFGFLAESGIPSVDMLPALEKSVKNQLYVKAATDMHPGKNGYKVIGETVAAWLREHSGK